MYLTWVPNNRSSVVSLTYCENAAEENWVTDVEQTKTSQILKRKEFINVSFCLIASLIYV